MVDPLYRVKVTCLCCETVFETSKVRPSFKKVVKTDTDFCTYYKDINPDYYVVRVCPSCGFSFTESFSQNLLPARKKHYLDTIGSKWQSKRDYGGERDAAMAMETFKLALITGQTVGEKERVIASILHHIAWMYRRDGKTEEEKRFLEYALDSYVRVYETDREANNSARLMYLIGELNRRLGRFHEAVRWFSRVVQDHSIMDATMIRASREQWQVIREELEAEKKLARTSDSDL